MHDSKDWKTNVFSGGFQFKLSTELDNPIQLSDDRLLSIFLMGNQHVIFGTKLRRGSND